ncbi:MAG: hypothetical protein H6Q73_3808 [Firmicutes bacterium]|nr:hypothetical protein [Bacillota bacterium]
MIKKYVIGDLTIWEVIVAILVVLFFSIKL